MGAVTRDVIVKDNGGGAKDIIKQTTAKAYFFFAIQAQCHQGCVALLFVLKAAETEVSRQILLQAQLLC